MPQPPLPETPFLALDLEAFERNVAQMVQTIVVRGGKQWRPHVKAIRAPALAQRLVAAGAIGVTCSTVGEAETMVAAGIRDVLIASQVVAPGQLRRLAALNHAARVIVAIDAPVHIAGLAEAAQAAGVVIPVVVELEVGIQRAGVAPGDAALVLARKAQAQHGVRFAGLMAWEGHTTTIADPAEKRQAVQTAVGHLTDTAQLCRDAGLPVEVVSCGGTGTFPITSTLAGVTELQAGGGVFGDVRYRHDYHIPLEPALSLRATVLSRPSARRIVCNAGWRYLSVYPTLPQPLHLNGSTRLAPSAEHLTLDCSEDVAGYAVGDAIEFAVGYADSTVFLHREIVALRRGRVEEVVSVPVRPYDAALRAAAGRDCGAG